MIKVLKLLAVLLTLFLLVMVFYGIFKGIFNTPGFWLLYLLIMAADLMSIAFIKKYNGQRKC